MFLLGERIAFLHFNLRLFLFLNYFFFQSLQILSFNTTRINNYLNSVYKQTDKYFKRDTLKQPNYFKEPQKLASLEEVLIYIHIKDFGSYEIPAYINKHQVLIPVLELFNLLRIKNIPTSNLKKVDVWSINGIDKYIIDIENKRIITKSRNYKLKENDILKTDTDVFLNTEYLEEIFHITTEYSFRTLAVTISSNIEFPAIKIKRQEKIRQNLNKLKNIYRPDTVVAITNKNLDFGTLNWQINSIDNNNGTGIKNILLRGGGQLLGGEFSGTFNYTLNRPILKNQQQYLWGKVNNDANLIKQFYVGKIPTTSISTINFPIIGSMITNVATEQENYFSSYIINEQTTPGWKVELYINDRLVDFTEANSNGFFTFEVPIVYGNMKVTLKYYGPWGELQTEDRQFNIPFNFVPTKKLNFTASAGFLEDGLFTKYANIFANYGFSRHITFGIGLEHLSSLKTPYIPFTKSSIRIGNNILLNAEYMHQVKQSANFNIDLLENIKVIYEYTSYNTEQDAIFNNFKSEQNVSIIAPFKLFNKYFFSKINLNSNKIKNSNDFITNGESVITFNSKKFRFGLTSNILYFNNDLRFFNNKFSLSYSFPNKLNVTSNINYELYNKFQSIQILAQKDISKKSFISTSLQHNFIQDLTTFNVSYIYNIDVGLLSSNLNFNKNNTTITNTLSGSILHNNELNYTNYSRLNRVGNSGFVFVPFLDFNGNGVKDKNEQKVSKVSVFIKGGTLKKNVKDTTIVALNLRPYKKYNVVVNDKYVDNISWRPKHKTYQISAMPSELKTIYIPFNVAGEVAGYVYLNKQNSKKGMYGLKVEILKNNKIIATTLTEVDGYFSYLGLPPGNYTAKINSEQLNKLNLKTISKKQNFSIKQTIDGDFVDHIKFNCVKLDNYILK